MTRLVSSLVDPRPVSPARARCEIQAGRNAPIECGGVPETQQYAWALHERTRQIGLVVQWRPAEGQPEVWCFAGHHLLFLAPGRWVRPTEYTTCGNRIDLWQRKLLGDADFRAGMCTECRRSWGIRFGC